MEHTVSFGELFLNPAEPDSYSIGAIVTRAVQMNGVMNLLFKGRDPESGETYEGSIQLTCCLGMQSTDGKYTNMSRSKPPEKRSFRLTGSFLDTSYDCFEGLWIEPEFTLECSIEGIKVEG